MSGLFRRALRKAKALARPLYTRFPVLQRAYHSVVFWKPRAWVRLQAEGISSDNLPAIQALSEKRFDNDMFPDALADAAPMQWPEIDLSIVTYNSGKWLEQFFESLHNQNYPLDRIHVRVVDHGSTDETVTKLNDLLLGNAEKFASARIINQANLGFGAGHHRAISESSSDYVLITNVDLAFRADSITGVVQAALPDTSGRVASWELRQVPYEHPKYYDPVTLETNWSSHACILMRRVAYERVGGYDTRLFMYAEDVELSYRYRSFGYALRYVPSAVVHHYTYETAGEVKPMQFAGSTLGNVLLRARYGQRPDRWAGIKLYFFLFLLPPPCPGAKPALLKNAVKLLRDWRHFRNGRGPAKAWYPFRTFDYELVRDGAFVEVEPLDDRQQPLVSIITRTYRGRSMFLTQAVQSAFNQTYPRIEMVVVEDGGNSQHDLVDVLSDRAPAHVHLRYIARPKEGRSAAGNAGLAAATGQYLMFLDDDDLLFADHVEVLMAALQKDPESTAAYALASEVHTRVADDQSAYEEIRIETPNVFHQEWSHTVLQDHNYIPIQAILFKRELYERHGGFDVALDQLEDWHLWLRYGHDERFVFVPKTTSLFRSPADDDVRNARLKKLHEAYHEARDRALAAINIGTQGNAHEA